MSYHKDGSGDIEDDEENQPFVDNEQGEDEISEEEYSNAKIDRSDNERENGDTGGSDEKHELHQNIDEEIDEEDKEHTSDIEDVTGNAKSNSKTGSNATTYSDPNAKYQGIASDFNPNELVPKLTSSEKLSLMWLNFKATLPMAIALIMIYYIFLVYMFTYLIPLISDDYNEKNHFFHPDTDDLPGLRQLPQGVKCCIFGFV